nr:MAG TPA: hypothetical protein [Caudoviricetes sp.]
MLPTLRRSTHPKICTYFDQEYCIIFGTAIQSRTFVLVLAVIFVPFFKYNYIGV